MRRSATAAAPSTAPVPVAADPAEQGTAPTGELVEEELLVEEVSIDGMCGVY